MPKKTARRTRKHRKSPSKKVGLIAREKNADQSAQTKSALDNRFHRTALPISCGVVISFGFLLGDLASALFGPRPESLITLRECNMA